MSNNLVETPRAMMVALANNNLNWDYAGFCHRMKFDPAQPESHRLWLAFVRAAADLSDLCDLTDAELAILCSPEHREELT
jgi:hypothetical protein